MSLMRMPSPLLPFGGMQNSKRRMKFSNSRSVQRFPPPPLPLPGWHAITGNVLTVPLFSFWVMVSTPYDWEPHHPVRSLPLKSETNPSSILSG